MSGTEETLHRLGEAYGAIVERAVREPGFRDRLKSEPTTVLNEAGIAVPPSLELIVVENTADRLFLPLPAARDPAELSDTALDGVSGGGVLAGIAIVGVAIAAMAIALASGAAIGAGSAIIAKRMA